jgi:hypothetical protein
MKLRSGRASAFRLTAILALVLPFTTAEGRAQFATQYLSTSYNSHSKTVTGYSSAEVSYMGSHMLTAYVQVSSPSGRTATSTSGYQPLFASTTTVLSVMYEAGNYWVQTANLEFSPVLNDSIPLATLGGSQNVKPFIDVISASFSPASLNKDLKGTATLTATVYASTGVTAAVFDSYEVSKTGGPYTWVGVADASRALTPGQSQIVDKLGTASIKPGASLGSFSGHVNVRVGPDIDVKNSLQEATLTIVD